MQYIEFDSAQPSNEAWKRLMSEKLSTAQNFEIHCWSEEADCIAAALDLGVLKDAGWSWRKVISGPVTPAFTAWLLSLPKPADTEIHNKMTPFFSIFLDNGFSSEHYGTELNQR